LDIWQPICPTSYNALGTLSSLESDGSPQIPDYTVMACVHDRCVEPCFYGSAIFSDQDNPNAEGIHFTFSGDAVFYSAYGNAVAMNTGSFFLVPSFTAPTSSQTLLCLKKYVRDIHYNLYTIIIFAYHLLEVALEIHSI
jgi:hypothetical protein